MYHICRPGGGVGNPYNYNSRTSLGNPPGLGTSDSEGYFHHPNQPPSTLTISEIRQVLAARQNAHLSMYSPIGGGFDHNSLILQLCRKSMDPVHSGMLIQLGSFKLIMDLM